MCAIIEAIQVEELETPETTYNFEVEDFHTYYVTESKVLVHNMCYNLEADDILNSIIDNPQSIQDYSLDEIKSIANQSNWHQGTLVRGPNKGLGFKVSSSSKGSIIFNPGQVHHFGGAPYWKVSSGTKGVFRFLYLR